MVDLGDFEMAFECLLNVFPLSSVAGCDADEMSGSEGGGRNV